MIEYDIKTTGGPRRVRGHEIIPGLFACRPLFDEWILDHLPSGMRVGLAYQDKDVCAFVALELLELDFVCEYKTKPPKDYDGIKQWLAIVGEGRIVNIDGFL